MATGRDFVDRILEYGRKDGTDSPLLNAISRLPLGRSDLEGMIYLAKQGLAEIPEDDEYAVTLRAVADYGAFKGRHAGVRAGKVLEICRDAVRAISPTEEMRRDTFETTMRASIQDRLMPLVQPALDAQKAADEAIEASAKRYSMAGMSFPHSSLGFSVSHGDVHLNVPSASATSETIAMIDELLAEAEERSGLTLDATRTKGGSNYVVKGRLSAPTPAQVLEVGSSAPTVRP